MASNDYLVWLDMEMTGLDPERCVPLQVAVVITDADLQELDSSEVTIHQPESALAVMDGFVRKMHTDNGLLKAVAAADATLADAEEQMLAVVSKWTKAGDAVLAGNSIHQDRRFIVRYFPRLNEHLHYRMVDVSTLKELARRWYGKPSLYKKTGADHTALADVRESIRELAHYRNTLFQALDGDPAASPGA